MSWVRIKHPSELFAVADEVKVKVLKYDREKERVSLGLNQVSLNSWDEAEYKFPVGVKVKGIVVTLKEYGAVVEIEEGVEVDCTPSFGGIPGQYHDRLKTQFL